MATDFHALGLRPELLAALELLSYVETTPIQAQALPPILSLADVVGQAKTGSGKTAAFGLGLLQPLEPDRLEVQALVMCPSRELAEQVATELRRLARRLPNTRIVTICGGRPFRAQRLALEQGAQVVVGTPGRIAAHLRKQTLDLATLSTLVLDEADRMLDMGFIDEVGSIIDRCPADRQTLLFSATFPTEIRALSAQIQNHPVPISVDATVAAEQLRQLVYTVEPGQRHATLVQVLARHRPESALIFCETRSDCDRLATFLTRRGAFALALHGGLEQRERDDVLVQFANGSTRLLVATNLAARGIDIPELPAVVIAELSPDPDSHLHRIGRTGRAGQRGLAVSLVMGATEHQRLARVEAVLDEPIQRGAPLDQGSAVTFLTPVNRTLVIGSGRKDKLRKGDVLGALVKDGGIPADAIGRIDLADKSCAVAIRRDLADRALTYLQRARVKNKRVRAVLLGT